MCEGLRSPSDTIVTVVPLQISFVSSSDTYCTFCIISYVLIPGMQDYARIYSVEEDKTSCENALASRRSPEIPMGLFLDSGLDC